MSTYSPGDVFNEQEMGKRYIEKTLPEILTAWEPLIPPYLKNLC